MVLSFQLIGLLLEAYSFGRAVCDTHTAVRRELDQPNNRSQLVLPIDINGIHVSVWHKLPRGLSSLRNGTHAFAVYPVPPCIVCRDSVLVLHGFDLPILSGVGYAYPTQNNKQPTGPAPRAGPLPYRSAHYIGVPY